MDLKIYALPIRTFFNAIDVPRDPYFNTVPILYIEISKCPTTQL